MLLVEEWTVKLARPNLTPLPTRADNLVRKKGEKEMNVKCLRNSGHQQNGCQWFVDTFPTRFSRSLSE